MATVSSLLTRLAKIERGSSCAEGRPFTHEWALNELWAWEQAVCPGESDEPITDQEVDDFLFSREGTPHDAYERSRPYGNG